MVARGAADEACRKMMGEWSYAIYLGQTAWLLGIRFLEQRVYPSAAMTASCWALRFCQT